MKNFRTRRSIKKSPGKTPGDLIILFTELKNEVKKLC